MIFKKRPKLRVLSLEEASTMPLFQQLELANEQLDAFEVFCQDLAKQLEKELRRPVKFRKPMNYCEILEDLIEALK